MSINLKFFKTPGIPVGAITDQFGHMARAVHLEGRRVPVSQAHESDFDLNPPKGRVVPILLTESDLHPGKLKLVYANRSCPASLSDSTEFRTLEPVSAIEDRDGNLFRVETLHRGQEGVSAACRLAR